MVRESSGQLETVVNGLPGQSEAGRVGCEACAVLDDLL